MDHGFTASDSSVTFMSLLLICRSFLANITSNKHPCVQQGMHKYEIRGSITEWLSETCDIVIPDISFLEDGEDQAAK